MKGHTYRELKLWIHWLDQQWNVPDLVCYYIMQLNATVNKFFNKRSKIIDFFLKFSPVKRAAPSETRRQMNDAVWNNVPWVKKTPPTHSV